MVVVEARNLTWKYRGGKKPALNNVNIEVKEGEFLAITGPSGSGKTTLILSLTGVIPQQLPGEFYGEVKVLGHDTTRTQVSEIARQVGVVFEDPEIQFVMSTVEDEIILGLETLGLGQDELQERLEWSLGIVGLDKSFLPRAPLQLSGGEKQRVAIASAIARKPRLLLLDEPTSDLDPQGKEEVVSALRNLRDEYKTTIIMVEHEPELIEEFADRLLVMDEGEIVLEGTPEEIYELGEAASSHAAYPPDYYELAEHLKIKPARRDKIIEAVRENRVNLNGFCNYRVENSFSRKTVVSVRNVWFGYTTQAYAVKGVSLDLREGELAVLMGPNGSGKTTLSKIIAGLLKPTKGDIIVNGKEIGKYSRVELASLVAYIYQNPQHQIFNQTVWDEVAFGWKLRGVHEKDYAEKVDETLALFKLKGLEKEHPFFLSKGEKRRLAIASVYTLDPKVLIVDEPTTGQDRRLSEQLMSTFKSFTENGKAVLVVTHSISVATRYADRLIVMEGGRIIGDGPPRQVLQDDDVVRRAHLRQPIEIEVCRELQAVSRGHNDPYS